MKETADQWSDRWEIWTSEDENISHVVPLDDQVEHELEDGCVCGPELEPVIRSDGTIGWLYAHPALDGRL